MKHLGTKTIETERLILRRFTMEDAPKMYENWASDSEVTKFLMWTAHTSIEVSERVLAMWIEEYEKEDKYEWCIELKETGEPIGSLGAFNINERVSSVEVGYCISRKYWHQGVTSEALKAVLAFLFEEVGVERVESRHDARNPHSGQVMTKCGLRYEGKRIRADWNNSGICDSCIYGLLKEWYEETGQENGAEEAAEHQRQAEKMLSHTSENVISDETIEYVSILAKLELSGEEKEQAKKDMGSMLSYIDKLNELDTTGVEPMSHVFPMNNVFREDVVENGDDTEAILSNAPEKKDGSFKVPKTVEQEG